MEKKFPQIGNLIGGLMLDLSSNSRIPTNGDFTDRMVKQISQTLEEKSLRLFAVEFSLDGMPDFHDTFRAQQGAFEKSIQSYNALVELQKQDSRLWLHAISSLPTAT